MVTCRRRNVMILSPYSFFSRTYIHIDFLSHVVPFWSFFLKQKCVLRILQWLKKDHFSSANFGFSSGFVLVFQKRYCVCGTKKNERKLINISFAKELLTRLSSRLVGGLAWLRMVSCRNPWSLLRRNLRPNFRDFPEIQTKNAQYKSEGKWFLLVFYFIFHLDRWLRFIKLSPTVSQKPTSKAD